MELNKIIEQINNLIILDRAILNFDLFLNPSYKGESELRENLWSIKEYFLKKICEYFNQEDNDIFYDALYDYYDLCLDKYYEFNLKYLKNNLIF